MLARGTPTLDANHATHDFASAVREGLARPHKSLPCRFLYDPRGSALFERITTVPEYYPTRTELSILETHATEMTTGRGQPSVLVELGSGSSLKTEILLRTLPDGLIYIPIDVSVSALADAARRLKARFPTLDIRPLVGDFASGLTLPGDLPDSGRIAFFPGSTIGNFTPDEAMLLLSRLRTTIAPDRLLIGVDLKKAPETLVRAYADEQGVTAAFNLNLLTRINRELGADFDLAAFRHRALFNEPESRIEMHLESRAAQTVRLAGVRFAFAPGETIHTENSYKYAASRLMGMARAAGWRQAALWTDPRGWFAVAVLEAA